ncbi:hypothetical protein AX14_002112 [Amanita brunnescens Koide BX004]|nr:hypothetical protein AX14_002112 [Amanita brunnescens Koide BX004]
MRLIGYRRISTHPSQHFIFARRVGEGSRTKSILDLVTSLDRKKKLVLTRVVLTARPHFTILAPKSLATNPNNVNKPDPGPTSQYGFGPATAEQKQPEGTADDQSNEIIGISIWRTVLIIYIYIQPVSVKNNMLYVALLLSRAVSRSSASQYTKSAGGQA